MDWDVYGPKLLAAVRKLTSVEEISLGDLVYDVREREGQGWGGPSVIAWSDAVAEISELLKLATNFRSK